ILGRTRYLLRERSSGAPIREPRRSFGDRSDSLFTSLCDFSVWAGLYRERFCQGCDSIGSHTLADERSHPTYNHDADRNVAWFDCCRGMMAGKLREQIWPIKELLERVSTRQGCVRCATELTLGQLRAPCPATR